MGMVSGGCGNVSPGVSIPANCLFTEHEIIAALKPVVAGRTVRDVCREPAISQAIYYNWKAKYGGMNAADIKKIKDLENENRHK